MPSTKDFSRHIEIFDECLPRRQKKWPAGVLLETFNEKLTTIRKDEAARLKDGINISLQVSDYSITEDLEAIFPKFNITVTKIVLDRYTLKRIVEYTSTSCTSWLDNLFSAVREKSELPICFRPFFKTENHNIFHPNRVRNAANVGTCSVRLT